MSDDRTLWLMQARWGIMCHYLAAPASSSGESDVSAEQWNRQVDRFDVSRFGEQLADVGAGYVIFTVGQNSGHYCSPNATYDGFTGIRPSKCSERDLIAELGAELRSRGIKLIVYVPSGAPACDPIAAEKLEWVFHSEADPKRPFDRRLSHFQNKWEAVIREWSLRWGELVHGWWIDGCYFADEMYRHRDRPNFESLTAALKSGNPDAIVAYNPGIVLPVAPMSEFDDYTAGEVDFQFPADNVTIDPLIRGIATKDRWARHAQYHVLSFLGQWWGLGEPRFPDEWVAGYTRYVHSRGGAITWDVPVSGEGIIPDAYLRQLRAGGGGERTVHPR